MRKILLALLIAYPCFSHAWFHLEPAIGYNKGQFDSNALSGIGLDLRVGFDIKEIFIVGDIGYHNVQQGSISSVTYTDQGATIGINLQKYRMWYGLITSSSFTYTNSGTTTTETGTGSKLGVSAEIGNSVYINLETRFVNYTNLTVGSTASTPTDLGTVGYLSISYVL